MVINFKLSWKMFLHFNVRELCYYYRSDAPLPKWCVCSQDAKWTQKALCLAPRSIFWKKDKGKTTKPARSPQPSPTCLSPCLGLEETLHKGLSLPSWAIWKPQIVMGTPENKMIQEIKIHYKVVNSVETRGKEHGDQNQPVHRPCGSESETKIHSLI